MRKIFLCFSICLVFVVFMTINIYGYTVDDVRDLLGESRVDDTFTPSEIDLIVKQYEAIEKANLKLKLLDLGKEISIDKNIDKEHQVLNKELEDTRDALSNSFKNGDPLSKVLILKSNLESVLTRIKGLKQNGYDINIDYIPNIWEEKYQQVQKMIKGLSTQFSIGVVGSEMKLPFEGTFDISSPYGLRLNPFTKDSVSMHFGLDFKVSTGTYVYSQWNGVVSRIYENESGGKTIEISHGPDLKTYYMHLSEYKVRIGDTVEQYQLIALSGNTGNSTGPHLHFGVHLDGEYINPIYLYGYKGLQAFKTYISNNPEKNLEIAEIEAIIKNRPDKIIENEIVIEPNGELVYYPEYSPDSYFDSDTFFEEVAKQMEIASKEASDLEDSKLDAKKEN